MRGFASILFLTLVVELLALLAIPLHAFQDTREIEDVLLLRRTEMENGIDSIVREGLQKGLMAPLPPEAIKSEINGRIIDYLNAFQSRHEEPIAYEAGFSQLTHQSYLSLLLQPAEKPLTLAELNQNSHVLVLPLSQTVRYGEYAYTGGLVGTHILTVHIQAGDHQTLFALPTGYRACGITGPINLPCVAGEK